MLTSQAFRDYFPSSLSPFSLKVAGALLKDSPYSFSLGGYATTQNRPELLAQQPTVGSSLKKCHVGPSPLDTQTTPCNTWHRSFHPDGKFSLIPPERESLIPPGRESLIPPGRLISGILSGRRSTSPDISHPAPPCRQIGEEDDSISLGRHVRILR